MYIYIYHKYAYFVDIYIYKYLYTNIVSIYQYTYAISHTHTHNPDSYKTFKFTFFFLRMLLRNMRVCRFTSSSRHKLFSPLIISCQMMSTIEPPTCTVGSLVCTNASNGFTVSGSLLFTTLLLSLRDGLKTYNRE